MRKAELPRFFKYFTKKEADKAKPKGTGFVLYNKLKRPNGVWYMQKYPLRYVSSIRETHEYNPGGSMRRGKVRPYWRAELYTLTKNGKRESFVTGTSYTKKDAVKDIKDFMNWKKWS